MNNARKSVTLGQILFRNLSKTAPTTNEVVTPKFQKLKETQKRFGVEDNVPVYLKGGVGDQLLYRLTWAVTLVGLGFSLETWYQLAMK